MAILGAYDVVNSWVSVGGPVKLSVAWASVSLAESSWDTEAVSPTDARGLYQIEPYSWPAGAGPLADWIYAERNSLAAVILSGGGVNFAPWDTAYANIGASGRYTFLAWPEPGSAAADNIPYVASLLGTHYFGGPVPVSYPGITGTLPDALRWYSEATNSVLPILTAAARQLRSTAQRMY